MVAAVSVVRDEVDIIERTVGHMAAQVDLVIVADNGSTDGTRDILDSLPVTVVDDDDPAHFQGRKMTALADQARELGADWVIPFDADELWLCRDRGRIAENMAQLSPEVFRCEAAIYDHVATPDGFGWRRPAACPLRKIAPRAVPGLVIHDGNHGATIPGVRHPPTVTDLLEIRHFPLRSPEHMIRKARHGGAALAATDLPAEVGAHWRQWSTLTDEQITQAFYEHYFSHDPEGDGLIHDPAYAG